MNRFSGNWQRCIRESKRCHGRVMHILFCVVLSVFTLSVPAATLGADPEGMDREEQPQLVLDCQGHHNVIHELIFHPGSNRLCSLGLDKAVRIWDLESGKVERTLRLRIGDDFAGSFFSGAISGDGKWLALGGRDLSVAEGSEASVTVFDLEKGEVARVLPGHSASIVSLDFSPDGNLLASGSLDGVVHIWDVSRLAAGYDRGVEGDFGATVLSGHDSGVYSLRFSKSGGILFSASLNGTMVVWSAESAISKVANGQEVDAASVSERLRITLEEGIVLRAADLSPDGRLIVSGDDGGRLLIWDAESGDCLGAVDQTSTSPVTVVKIAPDGDRFFASSLGFAEGGVAVGKAAVYSLGEEPREIHGFEVDGNRVSASAWSHDGGLVAFCDGADHTITVWKSDGIQPERVLETKGAPVTDVAVKEIDGNLVAAFGFLPNDSRDLSHSGIEYTFNFQELRLQQVRENGEELIGFRRSAFPERLGEIDRIGNDGRSIRLGDGSKVTLPEPGNSIRDYIFDPEGNVVICHNFGVTLFDAGGQRIRDFVGHEGTVRSAAISPGGDYLVTASEDRTLRVWDFVSGRLLVSLFVANPIENDWVCWAPNGYFDASANGGNYFGWHVDRGRDQSAKFLPSDRLFDHYYRPELIRECVSSRSDARDVARIMNLVYDPLEAHRTAPRVEFVGYAADAEVAAHTRTQRFQVKATAQGEGVEGIMVFHEGKGVHPIGPGFSEDESIILPFEIDLVSGKNVVRVVARSERGAYSEDLQVTFSYDGEKVASNLHILAVGIDEYANEMFNLNFCRIDAMAFVEHVSLRADGLFKGVFSTSLFDSDVTRSSLKKQFREIAERAGPEDAFVFFFAGHGAVDGDSLESQDFYFMLHDVTQMHGNPEMLKERAISASELKVLCGRVKATKQFIVIDACEAGAFADKFASSRVRGGAAQRVMANLARSTGTAILTGAGPNEFARETDELGHGLFTFSLLNSLSEGANKNGDGQITVSSIYSWVSDELPVLSFEHTGVRQIPYAVIMGNDFPIGMLELDGGLVIAD